MEESSLKVKNNKYKIMHQALFERRLQEYYDYVKKHGKQPDKTVCFKDGRQMGHWKSGFLTIIKKVSQLGDERATYILNVKNITKKLSFDDKCIEGETSAAVKTAWEKLSVSLDSNGSEFHIQVTGVPYGSCNQLLKMDWVNVSLDANQECSANGETTLNFTAY